MSGSGRVAPRDPATFQMRTNVRSAEEGRGCLEDSDQGAGTLNLVVRRRPGGGVADIKQQAPLISADPHWPILASASSSDRLLCSSFDVGVLLAAMASTGAGASATHHPSRARMQSGGSSPGLPHSPDRPPRAFTVDAGRWAGSRRRSERERPMQRAGRGRLEIKGKRQNSPDDGRIWESDHHAHQKVKCLSKTAGSL